ncbi:uncharacterized protein LOC117318015 [Pecten maximus]|uniref:uncharacterized protein LOC117318015 n=1 Tax=Pecten maximus TaxID=6579 RepID=UPI0014586659|nr:uncharacterized protein LOC117318015 [Pecten maximus]
MTTYIYTCGLWMMLIGFVWAQQPDVPKQYGSCTQYCGTAKPPVATGVINVCMESNNCTYCKFVPNCCPEVSCENPQKSPDGRCLLCPGKECAYEEIEYSVNDVFMSVDEVNTCKCRKGGKVKCKKNPLPPLPEFCS